MRPPPQGEKEQKKCRHLSLKQSRQAEMGWKPSSGSYSPSYGRWHKPSQNHEKNKKTIHYHSRHSHPNHAGHCKTISKNSLRSLNGNRNQQPLPRPLLSIRKRSFLNHPSKPSWQHHRLHPNPFSVDQKKCVISLYPNLLHPNLRQCPYRRSKHRLPSNLPA